MCFQIQNVFYFSRQCKHSTVIRIIIPRAPVFHAMHQNLVQLLLMRPALFTILAHKSITLPQYLHPQPTCTTQMKVQQTCIRSHPVLVNLISINHLHFQLRTLQQLIAYQWWMAAQIFKATGQWHSIQICPWHQIWRQTPTHRPHNRHCSIQCWTKCNRQHLEHHRMYSIQVPPWTTVNPKTHINHHLNQVLCSR